LQFSDFNFSDRLNDGLYDMGFDKPTPIQEMAIPVIQAGKDLIACAQTGTGKTAAFVLPILNKLATSENNQLNTLILAPTRELAMQIDQQIEGFSYYLGVSSIPVYGGGSGETFLTQKRALEMGAEIVIATPGRLIALLSSGKIDFKNLKHLILDEADRMLDMGFFDDIVHIIGHIPTDRQTILFSATMPPNIRKLAQKIMLNPESINIATSKPAEGIDQKVLLVNEEDKFKTLVDILKPNTYESVIVFVGTKDSAKKLERKLQDRRILVKSFHSDLEQEERIELINDFKSKRVNVLVGTDILSRGIDIDGIELVINYDLPSNPEDFIHRIGRTARGDKKGTAIAIVSQTDRRKLARVEKLIDRKIVAENLTGKELTAVVTKDNGPYKKKKFFKKKPSNGPPSGPKS
jgi:ATP-dependent RNA helicase RhlE